MRKVVPTRKNGGRYVQDKGAGKGFGGYRHPVRIERVGARRRRADFLRKRWRDRACTGWLGWVLRGKSGRMQRRSVATARHRDDANGLARPLTRQPLGQREDQADD